LKSRREFIQASSALLTVSIPASSAEQPKGRAAEKTTAITRDYWNDLPNYFIAKVNATRAKRKSDLARVRSVEDASERATFVRKKAWDLIGGELEKTALNAKTTGTIDRSAYLIEKVIFESQPKFYVTAHLYIPKSGKQPFPGILAPLGHSSNGKAYTAYQTVFQNLARRGFAVLAWDPPGQGERLQYIDPSTNRSRYGPTGEHDRFGLQALLIGSTTTQFEVWDGIRALDYLLSRPEIDVKRIGCCGHSGGGTQTMFLCALEPRISAAIVVEGNSENLAGPNYQPPGAYADAEQNLIGGLTIPLDRGDLLCAFTPRPLLVCYTPIDAGTTYSPTYVEGTMEVFDELSAVYRASGAHDKVALLRLL
jgi:dienelactone hydrolase